MPDTRASPAPLPATESENAVCDDIDDALLADVVDDMFALVEHYHPARYGAASPAECTARQ